MPSLSYLERRGQLATYFDRTAVDAWSRLTSDAPVGRIRATVRAGRDEMRRTLLAWLPADLRGQRLLDAGCGTGALAVEAARRGARVVAIDLSPTLIDLARSRAPRELGAGSVEFLPGDMLDPALGRFDHVVAMDSLIHYRAGDAVSAIAGLAAAHEAQFAFHVRSANARACGDAYGRSLVPQAQSGARDRTDGRGGDLAPAGRGAAAGHVARRAHRPDRQRILCVAGAGADRAMMQITNSLARGWMLLGARFLPFADAATAELPLGRLMRLSLFQVSVGIAVVLLNGTLNRVMIVELGVPTWLVARDGVAAAVICAAARADRVPLGHPSFSPRMAEGALYLVRDIAAVRRACDHAVCTHRAVGRCRRASHCRPVRRGARLSAGRSRAPHHPDRRLGACHRSRPGGVAAACRGFSLCDAAGRHGGERVRARRAARRTSGKFASFR